MPTTYPAPMENIMKLRNDLRRNQWHITAFPFTYNQINYIVIFENLENLAGASDKFIVLLTFIDRNAETRRLSTRANRFTTDMNPSEFRDFFGIKYTYNVGNIFKEFYKRFGMYVPETRNEILDSRTLTLVIDTLSRDDHDNAQNVYCYAARHNSRLNGIQRHRTVFNSDKTKLLRPALFTLLGKDDTISFCYREQDELSDAEICAHLS